MSQYVVSGHSDDPQLLNEHANGTVENTMGIISRPGRFICRGLYPDLVHLYAEDGHLIWIDPVSSLQVLFTYGDTNCDFLCYLEPEVPGVSLTSLQDEVSANVGKSSGKSRANKKTPFHSGLSSSAAGSTGTRHSCLRTVLNPYSYAVDSVEGKCMIELRALNAYQEKELKQAINRPFKLNFQLVL
ncbi:unnamed protein product [Dicrocoelium dendriticum]|nr:unnamed protein product [Dicrocoelium dendriticum]